MFFKFVNFCTHKLVKGHELKQAESPSMLGLRNLRISLGLNGKNSERDPLGKEKDTKRAIPKYAPKLSSNTWLTLKSGKA